MVKLLCNHGRSLQGHQLGTEQITGVHYPAGEPQSLSQDHNVLAGGSGSQAGMSGQKMVHDRHINISRCQSLAACNIIHCLTCNAFT